MEQFFINNENMNVRVCKWGSDDNPTIICFHGLGSTNLSFLEIGELLKDKYHIISIDLPGHGRTPAFENDEDYGIPNLIKWVSDVIKLLNRDNFYILAHSWGGCIALHYAAKYPKKVKKILLLDGGYHQKQTIYDYFKKIDKEKLNFKPDCSLEEEIKSYEEDVNGYVVSNWNDFLEVERNNYLRWSELLEKASKDLMKEEEDGTIRFCACGDTARGAIKSMYNFPTNEIYKKLETPILLIQATFPESWAEIRNILVEEFEKNVNCLVKKVEATHLIHWDNPFFVVEEIMEWMK